MATGVGGSGVRPCDACGDQRAQWYCSADEAYLCSACDIQVHTANSIAGRHERVSLTTTTSAVRFPGTHLACFSSSWLRKRSRSRRRHGRSNVGGQQPLLSTPRTDAVLEHNVDKEEVPLSCFWSSDGVDEPLSWLCNHQVKSEPSEDVDCVETELEPKRLLDLNFDLCLVNEREMEKSKVRLQLNYEEVLSAWSDRGSPWAQAQAHSIMYPLDDTTSDLPGDGAGLEFGLVPDLASLGCWQSGREHVIGQVPVMIHGGDGQRPRAGGREARVMRYREKRQSRLFYKKIRYHVRKLNAENRPRMKGRFVKMTAEESDESLAL